MTGTPKHGDAVADVAREKFEENDRSLDNAITRLEVRAEMRSQDEDEISTVIDQRTLEVQRKKSSVPPPSGYGQQAILLIRSVDGWPKAVFGLALLALLGWVAWLKWHR